jgi:hypothetical protein
MTSSAPHSLIFAACDGEAVIAARGGDQPLGDLVVGERPELADRAARLERAGDLQAFELVADRTGAERALGRRGRDQRRAPHLAFDTGGGGADIVKRQHRCSLSLPREIRTPARRAEGVASLSPSRRFATGPFLSRKGRGIIGK